MRYIGQGHEISVTLPDGPLDADAGTDHAGGLRQSL